MFCPSSTILWLFIICSLILCNNNTIRVHWNQKLLWKKAEFFFTEQLIAIPLWLWLSHQNIILWKRNIVTLAGDNLFLSKTFVSNLMFTYVVCVFFFCKLFIYSWVDITTRSVWTNRFSFYKQYFDWTFFWMKFNIQWKKKLINNCCV